MTSNQSFALSIAILLSVSAWIQIRRARPSRLSNIRILPAGQAIGATTPHNFPPVPKWTPSVPVDIERTASAFANYTDNKKAFVVFENGTCVIVSNVSTDLQGDALKLLSDVYNAHPDFNPMRMDDGHYLISYSQPAYSVVLADEVETHRSYIDTNHLNGVVRDEVLLNAQGVANMFDEQGKIGLFGRARMFLDAPHPKSVRVYRPPNA